MHSGCHIDSDVYKSHNKSKSIYWDLFCNLFKSHFSSLDEPSKMQEICTVSPTNSQILTSVQRSNFRYCIYKRHSYVYSQIFLNRNRFFFFFFSRDTENKAHRRTKELFLTVWNTSRCFILSNDAGDSVILVKADSGSGRCWCRQPRFFFSVFSCITCMLAFDRWT